MGPATDSHEMVSKLFAAGVDVFRLNYSHESHVIHQQRIQMVRELSDKHNKSIAVIGDLQGPKIRIGCFKDGSIELSEGACFCIDVDLPSDAGDQKSVGVSYPELIQDINVGHIVLLDDGKIKLSVNDISGHKIHCTVISGGCLRDRKGINLQGGGLSTHVLTDKDKIDLDHAVSIGVDYIAVSFPRSAADIKHARDLLNARDSNIQIIAKIERNEALNNIEGIIEATDAIMIARGDLGMEIGDPLLPAIQKKLIKLAHTMNRTVITATQMMESMIENQMPTRAEVFDVANAVFDGTDVVMLSAETSIGSYPDKTVSIMADICEEAEKQSSVGISGHRLNERFKNIDETIAMSAMYAANHIHAAAIIALTETGRTCLWMSRISSFTPIFAFTRHISTRRRVALYRGVYPIRFEPKESDSIKADQQMIEVLLNKKLVREGDFVALTKGDLLCGERGGTNSVKLIQVKRSTES